MIEIVDMKLSDLNAIKNILTDEFDDFWNYEILKEELTNSSSKYVIAKEGNEIVGFAGLKIILDEADIMNIVTRKSFRNKGIGSLLLKYLIKIANEQNLKSITLEVNQENNVAIRLYEKYEFKNIGSKKMQSL